MGARKSEEYIVQWEFAEAGMNTSSFTNNEVVKATTAERAISKAKKIVAEEYSDKIVILQVILNS